MSLLYTVGFTQDRVRFLLLTVSFREREGKYCRAVLFHMEATGPQVATEHVKCALSDEDFLQKQM